MLVASRMICTAERPAVSRVYGPVVQMIIALALFAGAPATEQPVLASLEVTPAARELFERDWVLMNWALKFYDTNHDILLQPEEAKAAAEAFRKMADTNDDGRVTPEEYKRARNVILARY